MNNLNYDTYIQLCNQLDQINNGKPEKPNPWYDLSYPLFAGIKINHLDDLWKLTAFAYSWMPTIPEINTGEIKNEAELIKQLQCLPECSESELKDLLGSLVPVINNSLTGTSKVLHFISPENIPIIDSNVVKGWNYLFTKGKTIKGLSLPKTNNLNKSHITHYLRYRKHMLQWIENCYDVSLRELESSLFQLGQNIKNL